MTFGIIEDEEPLLAELISIAFESAGHDCLVLKSIDQAARILQSFRLDAIVLDIHMPGRNGLDWLEAMHPTWPDLPSRTLLLTDAALTPREEARVRTLGAEVMFRPASLVGVELIVAGRVQRARSERRRRSPHSAEEATRIELLN